jgi:predicted DNA binding CopG/RHH family protein
MIYMQLQEENLMANTDKFHASIEAWESGELGRDEEHVKVAEASEELALDDAMGMQMISIRLQKKLIDDLKAIAKHNGIGYQPLVRQLLTRFVVSEFKKMWNDAIAESRLKNNQMQPDPGTKTSKKKVA